MPDGTHSTNLAFRLREATVTAVGTCRVVRPDPRSLDRREQHHRAVFTACHLSDTTVLVTVTGEVDATNSRALAGYVERQIAGSTRLLLDLTVIDFLGTTGFAALHNVNVICARYGVSWALVVGPPLRRFLKICDPDNLLPVEDSAVDHLGAGPRDRELLVRGDH
jgi:anti-anti-sigma factor